MVELFRRIGFSVAEATEVESEHYCFDALNIPADHPARDMQDSYYLPDDLSVNNVSKEGDEKYLLRTHTSTVQIRTMLKEKPRSASSRLVGASAATHPTPPTAPTSIRSKAFMSIKTSRSSILKPHSITL